MAFPAANGPTFPVTLDIAWDNARSIAQSIQQLANNLNAQIAAGPVSSQAIINAAAYFYAVNVQLNTIAAVPGIAAYAQTQVNNPSLNVATAFSTMQTAMVACYTWITTNFPVDGAGYLECLTFSNGTLVWSTFTTAQLSGLATLLTALSATID